MDLNSYAFDAVYQRLGFKSAGLGCIMLDVDLPKAEFVPDLPWHTSSNPDRRYVSGQQSGTAHATLLYGLLTQMWDSLSPTDDLEEYLQAVDEVLDGWTPPTSLVLANVETFESPFADEPYLCVVAKIHDSALIEAHQRLSFLPHIDTFPEFHPHVTLGYIEPDHKSLVSLRWAYEGRAVPTTGINYGRNPFTARG